MLLSRFFQIIDNSFIGRFINKKISLIDQLNPDRIYIENIRAFYNMPYFAAKIFCDMAVAEGVFRKKIGIECSNDDCGRIVLSVTKTSEIPDEIKCSTCELLERDKYIFSKSEIRTITYYQLVD